MALILSALCNHSTSFELMFSFAISDKLLPANNCTSRKSFICTISTQKV